MPTAKRKVIEVVVRVHSKTSKQRKAQTGTVIREQRTYSHKPIKRIKPEAQRRSEEEIERAIEELKRKKKP